MSGGASGDVPYPAALSWPKNRAEHGHVETSQVFVRVSGMANRALLGCPV